MSFMKEDRRETQRKRRILEPAAETGNVCKTCRYFGIGRASFYRWQAAYRRHGQAGLVNLQANSEEPGQQDSAGD